MNLNPAFLSLIAVPFVASVIEYLIGRLSIRRNQIWGMNLARIFTLLVLAGEMVLLALCLKTALSQGSLLLTVGEEILSFDGVGLLLSAVVLLLGFLVVLFSTRYMAGEKGEEKFYALLLITIGCIIGMSLSFDLFNLWIWFEGMAISTYFLVAFYNEQPASLEAGIKYLVQSAIGSALVLFGIAIFFSLTGSTSFESIWRLGAQAGTLPLIGGILLIVGFGVKAALVPLHTWLPDAHSQAPSGISAMLSGVVIEAGLIAMLRSLSMMAKIGGNWGLILLVFGCLNILVGNLMALRQTEVKRLLAYSSIAHVGYMLLGFGFAFLFGEVNGAVGAFFHIITHSLMKGLAFLSAGAFIYVFYISNGKHGSLSIADLNGAARKYPLLAIGLSAAVLSLGGLPPFAGFMSKWQILVAGASTQNPWIWGVVIFAALNSVLSLGYYAPLINRMYRREPSEVVQKGKSVPWAMAVPIVILTIAIFVIGIWPTSVKFLTENASSGLLWFIFN
jgi:proton-translocating NADH-quinone oxidoreductase chain N